MYINERALMLRNMHGWVWCSVVMREEHCLATDQRTEKNEKQERNILKIK